MEIRNTKADEIDAVMQIYADARKFMAENNNPKQWGATNWPPKDLIADDIKNKRSFVLIDDENRICAVFCYIFGFEIDDTYKKIKGKWSKSDAYGVIHRIAVKENHKGFASICIKWALEKSKYLRIDTHNDNYVMQNLLNKLEFNKCGIIYVEEDNDPRIAFDKFI